MEGTVSRVRQSSILGVLAVMILLAWIPTLDSVAQGQIEAGFNRAIATFAVAKALNGAVSMVQSTQFSAQPFGVGVAVTVGEVLDPLNDLIEQFSSFMLAAAVAFGVQTVLVAIGGHLLVKVAFSLTVAAWGWIYFLKGTTPRWLTSAVVLLVMVRFAVPAVTVGSDAVFRHFLVEKYQNSQQEMKSAPTELNNMVPPSLSESGQEAPQGNVQPVPQKQEETGATGFFRQGFNAITKSAESAIGSVRSAVNVKAQLESFKVKAAALADGVTEKIINLIVVFLLQTLIVPLGMLWAMYRVASGVLSR